MSQATPKKVSMLFKHNYGKLFWKFGDHSFNNSFVHGPSWLWVLESIHRYGVIFTLWFFFQKVIVRPCLMSKKYTLLTFKGICMIFLLELDFLFQVTQWPQNSLIKSFRSFWDTLYILTTTKLSLLVYWIIFHIT